MTYFEVAKLDDLINVVMPHFDKYTLQSAKSLDSLLWEQCISLMVTKRAFKSIWFRKNYFDKICNQLGGGG